MDDMAAYYHPPPPESILTPQYPYYQPPLTHPSPLGAVQPPPMAVVPQPCQFHPQPPQQPPFAPYAPQSYIPQASYDEVRTLFIAGLPPDVKSREIYNLFRDFPGYESSHLRTSASTQPFAFAVFLDQQSAVAAMHALNEIIESPGKAKREKRPAKKQGEVEEQSVKREPLGLVFDLEKNSTLYIDLARSNSRSKRSRIDDERPVSEKRIKGSIAFSRGNPDSGVGSVHMPGMGNSAYNTIGYPSTQSHGTFDGRTVGDNTAAKLYQNFFSAPYVPRNVTPCATLFVANLGPTCSDQELIQVFSRCPGYLKLKMQSTYGARVAFVDFQDAACSSEALSHLQGTILYSSPPGEGMRLEYAKSRMGMQSKKSM